MNQDGIGLATPDASRCTTPIQLDLNHLIHSVCLQWRHAQRHRNIAVILDLDKDLPKTSANSERIECVLLGLFARSGNAIEKAKQGHGTITVHTAVKAGKIQFSVTDDGMPEPSSAPLERFFTRALEENMNLTTWAQTVQDQGGELFTWCPHHPSVTTIVLDLPITR